MENSAPENTENDKASKNHEDEFETIFGGAMTDALMNGVGLVRITMSPKGTIMGRVSREEYPLLIEHLKYIMDNPIDRENPPEGLFTKN
jgi:hypothetical protein